MSDSPTVVPAPEPHGAAPTRRRLSSLSIVLPCFNEAENVAAAVTEAHAAGDAYAVDHEVVVVDDGSTDGTGRLAEALAVADPRLTLVSHPENRGYGAAVRSGFAASRSDWVLLTDGDLQFDLCELQGFLTPALDHDLVAGYRIDRADPVARRAAAHAWNRLMRRTFGVALRDVDCAFKLMRGDALRELALHSDGAMVSTELLVRAGQAGWRITEVGVRHRPRRAGEATGGNLAVILRAFRERRALLRELHRGADGAAASAPAVPRASAT
jgi:glycosyltransferase involved in cell wall biosynthesis